MTRIQNRKPIRRLRVEGTRITTTIRRAIRTMTLQGVNWEIRICIFLLIGAEILYEEIPSIITDIWPEWAKTKVHWFLSPWYHEKIKINWLIKFAFDDLLKIVIFYCLAKIAKQYSNSLFLVMVIFFIYHVIDFCMEWWNFKSSHYFYYDLLWITIFCVMQAVRPMKEETLARIKSLF
jgi:hypothetical protein